jgi:hypothetical protein
MLIPNAALTALSRKLTLGQISHGLMTCLFKDDPLGIGKNSRELMMMVVNGELDEDTVPDSIANAAERLKDIRDERANMQVYFEARSPYGIRRKVIAAAASVFSKKFGFLVRESTVQRAWEEYRADRD